MEFLVPSLIMLLLASVVVFFVVPRMSSFLIFIISVVFLTLGVYSHYMMFQHEYTSSIWRDSIKAYAPSILIAMIVIGIIVSFSNLFTNMRFRFEMPRMEFFKPKNIKHISNVEGYSEIPLSKIKEIERQL